MQLPLTPIPVYGPFHRVGVDVIQFPKSHTGNRYGVVFIDYLTKWPEVFATSDQTALTIARLFVEQIVCRHGVPAQLLSDRGAAFLSHLLMKICELLGVEKLNTTAYHPQTDGLAERFNRTLTDMLAKKAERSGKDWDAHLPFVLFAYQASLQESTKESPFYLLYGHDPRLPTTLGLDSGRQQQQHLTDLDTYKAEVAFKFSEAWKLARDNIKKAQQCQKKHYDRRTRLPRFKVGDRVFVYMPAAKACKAYKFARPFYGPYRIVEQSETGVVVRPVDQPQADPIRVAYNRIRHCADSIPDVFWPTRAGLTQTRSKGLIENFAEEAITQTIDVVSGSESIPSRSRMNETKQQLWRSDKESQVDRPEVDEDGGSVIKRVPESAIWRSRLRPRNTGVVA